MASGAMPLPTGEPVPRYVMCLVNTGERFNARPDMSVLHAMEQLRCRGIPVGCRNGGCGVCKVEVLAGAYETAKMNRAVVSEEDEARHQVLACRLYPRSELQLRVVGKMARALESPVRRGGVSFGFDFSFDFGVSAPKGNQPTEET
jgi:ferredoxin